MKKKLYFFLAAVFIAAVISISVPAYAETQWVQKGSYWYLQKDGVNLTGWNKDGGLWYYLDPAKGGRMKTGWFTDTDKKEYYLKSSGAMALGWQKVAGQWYYFRSDGSKAYGWAKDNGKWYYLDTYNGVMVKDQWERLDGSQYYFDASGAMAQSEFKKIHGAWYYFKADGSKAVGWQKVDQKWYYFDIQNEAPTGFYQNQWLYGTGGYFFDASGAMVTGWKKIDDRWYYFKPDGKTARGFYKVDGSWYYFSYFQFNDFGGPMETGWIREGNDYYYMKPSGVMATGWIQDGERRYYLNPSTGAVDKNTPDYVDPHIHNYNYAVKKEATTCISDEILTYTCTSCGYSYDRTFHIIRHTYEIAEHYYMMCFSDDFGVVYRPDRTQEVLDAFDDHMDSKDWHGSSYIGNRTHRCTTCGHEYFEAFTGYVEVYPNTDSRIMVFD